MKRVPSIFDQEERHILPRGQPIRRPPPPTIFVGEFWQAMPLEGFLGHFRGQGAAPPARPAQPARLPGIGEQPMPLGQFLERMGAPPQEDEPQGSLPNLERYFPGGFGRHPCVGIDAGPFQPNGPSRDLPGKKIELMIFYRKRGLEFRCHSCGAPIVMNPDSMPWSGDHQPPSVTLRQPELLERVLNDVNFRRLGVQAVEDPSGRFQTVLPIPQALQRDFDLSRAHPWPAVVNGQTRQYLYPQCPRCSHRQG